MMFEEFWASRGVAVRCLMIFVELLDVTLQFLMISDKFWASRCSL